MKRIIRINIIMVGGNFFANIGAYLYYLVMGRLMTPSDYGALQSLISLTGLFVVPLATIGTVIAKYVSSYVGKGEYKKVAFLYVLFTRYTVRVFFIGGILFYFLTPFILSFLRLTNWLNAIILDIGLFFGLFIIVNKATLQGLSLFIELTISQFIESYGKLLLGFAALASGLGVSGAFGAFVFIGFVSFLYMTRILRKKLAHSDQTFSLPFSAMAQYAVPSFLATVGVVSFYSTDVIFVRHFFDAHNAGLYSALSVLGKIIFFGAAPVSVAMFPLVSGAHSRGERFDKIFLISLVATIAIAISVSTVYSLMPYFALGVMIGGQYLEAAPLLSRFSLFLSLVTVINLFALYFLSIHRVFPVYLVAAGALIQAVLIWFYHGSLAQVITMSLTASTILTVFLLISYVRTRT